MKARVKATGNIVEVTHSHNITSGGAVMKKIYKDQRSREYFDSELEFLQEKEEYIPDYWTRLEHQYAGMAMQGILNNPNGFENVRVRLRNIQTETALLASEFAHALVEKLNEKEEK